MHGRCWPPWPPIWRVHTDGGAGSAGGGIAWHLDGAHSPDDFPTSLTRLTSWMLLAGAIAMEADVLAMVSEVTFVHRAPFMGAVEMRHRPDRNEPTFMVAAPPVSGTFGGHGRRGGES